MLRVLLGSDVIMINGISHIYFLWEDKIMKKVLTAFFAVVLMAGLTGCGIIGNKTEKIAWKDEIVLAEKLPEREDDKGKIYTNSKSELRLNVDEVTPKQYYAYVDACKELGYTLESEEDDRSFKAYDQDGYKLELDFFETSAYMSINLSAPMEMEEITVPDSELGKQLPKPQSTKGNVYTNNDGALRIYFGGIPLAQYSAYVDECIASGFNVDADKNEKRFKADNSEGYSLTVSYEGNNVIEVYITAPKETESSSPEDISSDVSSSSSELNSEGISEENSQDEESTSGDILGDIIRPEVKEAIDSYEAFIDEYCEFMKKYATSDNPLTLMSEYMDYLQKVTEMGEKFDNMDSSDWTTAETAYYTEVMLRCQQKLLDAASAM